MLCRKEGGAMLFQGAVQCLVVLFVFLGRSNAVSQPNIVLILTDDQDVVLQGLVSCLDFTWLVLLLRMVGFALLRSQ